MNLFGTRAGGAVLHIVKAAGAFGLRSVCGRYVMPSEGSVRALCGTCHRIRPHVSAAGLEGSQRASTAFVEDAKVRKAERDARLSQSAQTDETTCELNSWEYSLNSAELEKTLEKIAKINARCANKGIPGGLEVEYTEKHVKEKNYLGVEIEYTVFMTKITGIAPQIPGWEFMATIDHDPNAGLVVRAYPGAGSVDRSLIRAGWCDHCQTTRYRTVTYVVRNTATGEQVQVGSSCIKDFTGWSALPYMFEPSRELSEGGFWGGPRDVSTLTALAVAWACVKSRGYVRTSDSDSTRSLVSQVLWPAARMTDADRAALSFLRDYSEQMYPEAQALREWIASDSFSGDNDFVLNLKAISSADIVNAKNLGMLCYAPEAYSRFLEKTLIRKVEAPTHVSQFIGEIGERWELTLNVESVRYIDNGFGMVSLFRMTDESGNIFKWFSSNDALDEYVGQKVSISAGIKSHKEWNGKAETGLTRCKVLEASTGDHMVKAAPVEVRTELPTAMLGDLDSTDVYIMGSSYYRIRVTKGTAYAQRHTPDGWQYAKGEIHNLARHGRTLTAEQAAHFGHTYGSCVFCHRSLTDERSTAVGYGPDCAADRGLPWGA